jgi:hypothetical protein
VRGIRNGAKSLDFSFSEHRAPKEPHPNDFGGVRSATLHWFSAALGAWTNVALIREARAQRLPLHGEVSGDAGEDNGRTEHGWQPSGCAERRQP